MSPMASAAAARGPTSFGSCAIRTSAASARSPWCSALLARIGALSALAEPALAAAALIAAASASRAALPVLMATLPPARDEGLGAGAGRPHPLRAAAAVAIAILGALALLPAGDARQPG